MKILTDPTRTFTDFHKTGINGGNGGSWSSSLLENNMETKTRRVDWYPEVPGFWFRGRPVPPGALLWVRFMWWFCNFPILGAIFGLFAPFHSLDQLIYFLAPRRCYLKYKWDDTWVMLSFHPLWLCMQPSLRSLNTLNVQSLPTHTGMAPRQSSIGLLHGCYCYLSCPYSIRLLSPNYVVM